MFKCAVTGGTFDHLHADHKAFLDAAFEKAEYVTIGVTSDRYVACANKKFKELIQPCKERKRVLEEYLNMKGYADKGEVCEVDGTYSDVLTPNYDVIFVSMEEDSTNGAKKANLLRENKGLKKLAVVEISAGMIMTADGERISSTRIRRYLKYHGGKV